MNLVERRADILRRLQAQGSANIGDLARELGVSSMTIRRDLQHFSDQGLLTVRAGNAYLAQDAPGDVLRATLAPGSGDARKQRIGREAAGLVESGDTILVDCGTTVLQMLRYLGTKRVTVFTNSLPVAGLVGNEPNIRIVYAPGQYSPDSVGMVGPLAADFFRGLRVDKGFIGAHGFDAAGGANEPVMDDAATKRAMLEAARESYLLVDSSKYGNVHLAAMSKLSDYTAVLTDSDFPTRQREELEAACNRVVYA